MRIKTRTCSRHRPHYGWTEDHSAHAYRLLHFGPARRCPAETWMAQSLQWRLDHPTVEERTLAELRRIRELLEQHQPQS